MDSSDIRHIYIDPYSLLVATSDKRIIRIYCPFTVQAKRDIGEIRSGEEVLVDMVKSDPDGWLIYIIQGKAYWYGNFQVIE